MLAHSLPTEYHVLDLHMYKGHVRVYQMYNSMQLSTDSLSVEYARQLLIVTKQYTCIIVHTEYLIMH